MRFGRTIPVLIAIVFSIDLAARLIPTEYFSYRAWEAVSRYRYGFGPFEPNKYYASDQTFGDLPVLGNLPRYRAYHPEVFATDDCGFRNGGFSYQPGKSVDAVTIGSSFTVGSGVSDNDVLAAQLAANLGMSVYNAGGLAPAAVWIERLLERLQMHHGILLVEYLEGRRENLRISQFSNGTSVDDPCDTSRWYVQPKALYAMSSGFFAVSPLQILTQRLVRYAKNDVVLPNTQNAVLPRRLKNGQTMLFLEDEIVRLRIRRSPGPFLEPWQRFARSASARDLKLVLMLVPAKYAVYSPLLENGGEPGAHDELAEFEAAAVVAGIPTINLKPLLQDAAAAGLNHKHYVYFTDDTHWNANGIRLAARAVAEKLAALE